MASRAVSRPFVSKASAVGCAAAVLLVWQGLASPAGTASRKPASKRAVPAPTPTPVTLYRAAGACARFVSGQLVVLAEPGHTGRVFRISEETTITVTPRLGQRVRILYVDTPEGPLARYLMPGPIESGRGAAR